VGRVLAPCKSKPADRHLRLPDALLRKQNQHCRSHLLSHSGCFKRSQVSGSVPQLLFQPVLSDKAQRLILGLDGNGE
jgi:hypothetical protein